MPRSRFAFCSLFVAILLSVPSWTAAQDSSPATILDSVAAHLDKSTIFVGHFDLKKLDPEKSVAALREIVDGALKKSEMPQDMKAMIPPMVDGAIDALEKEWKEGDQWRQFKNSGCNELYVIVNSMTMTQSPARMLLVLDPSAETVQIDRFQEKLEASSPTVRFQRKDGLIVGDVFQTGEGCVKVWLELVYVPRLTLVLVPVGAAMNKPIAPVNSVFYTKLPILTSKVQLKFYTPTGEWKDAAKFIDGLDKSRKSLVRPELLAAMERAKSAPFKLAFAPDDGLKGMLQMFYPMAPPEFQQALPAKTLLDGAEWVSLGIDINRWIIDLNIKGKNPAASKALYDAVIKLKDDALAQWAEDFDVSGLNEIDGQIMPFIPKVQEDRLRLTINQKFLDDNLPQILKTVLPFVVMFTDNPPFVPAEYLPVE